MYRRRKNPTCAVDFAGFSLPLSMKEYSVFDKNSTKVNIARFHWALRNRAILLCYFHAARVPLAPAAASSCWSTDVNGNDPMYHGYKFQKRSVPDPSTGKISTKCKTSVSAVAVAMLLVACGGGGGDSAPSTPVQSTPTTTTPPAPVVTPADIQTSVPAFTYAATSEENMFINALNTFRAQVGLGLLAQSPLLDKAAANHLAYVLKNDVNTGGTLNMNSVDPVTGRAMFHIESGDKPLFTGIQEIDRAKSVGYAGVYVGEQGAFGGGKAAQVAFDSLASTVYHRAGLMFQGPREVGIAVGQNSSQTFVMEVGYGRAQSQASDFVGVYPAANQTAVGLSAGVESPNPFPDLSTANADFPTKTGYSVTVTVKEGAILELVSFTLTEAGVAAPLDARVMTKDNDPNEYLAANFAVLVAKAPLKQNTKYMASFFGRVNNVAVKKDWSFTTR